VNAQGIDRHRPSVIIVTRITDQLEVGVGPNCIFLQLEAIIGLQALFYVPIALLITELALTFWLADRVRSQPSRRVVGSAMGGLFGL